MYKPVSTAELQRFSQESQFVECKKSLGGQRSRNEGLASLCGMLNADTARGSVLFGVAPDGTPVGVEPGDLDTAQRTLVEYAGNRFDPKLPLNLEVLECGGKHVLSLSAARPQMVPLVQYGGRTFIREGSTTRLLSLEEQRGLERRRNRDLHGGPWLCNRCKTWVGMLSGVVVTEGGPRRSYECGCGGEFWPAT